MRKYLTFLALSLFITLTIQAQQEIPTAIPTPNATALGKYGDIPVSYYSGRVGISIPLYKLSVKGVDMPITLDYDGSGILMNSLPSWTGHNWTLNVGGVITRHIELLPDEFLYPEKLRSKYKNNFECFSKLPEFLSKSKINDLQKYIYNDSTFFEPNIYTFNCMGLSGKFLLGNDGQWKVYCDQNVDVLFDVKNYKDHLKAPFLPNYPESNEPQPGVIEGFKLRDENGIIYEFGFDDNAIEYSINLFHIGEEEDEFSWYARSWYLNRITDRFGNELYKLHYNRGHYIIQLYNNFQEYDIGNNYTYYCFPNLFITTNESHHGSNFKFPYSAQLDSPSYLRTIDTADGICVNFMRGNSPQNMDSLYKEASSLEYDYFKGNVRKGWSGEYPFFWLQAEYDGADEYIYQTNNKEDILGKARLEILDSIEISSMNENDHQYRIKFNYNYNKRMHLNSVSIGDWKNPMFCYKMEYDNMDKLPSSYLTKSTDHWGYYNGVNRDTKFNEDYIYKEKEPNIKDVKYGMLKKLIYPTGGASLFEYEPNSYSKCMSEDRQKVENREGLGGGLRIRSITNYDDETCKRKTGYREFRYINPITGKSSGELFSKPKYVWFKWAASVLNDRGGYSYQTTKRETSIIPLSNSFGPSIGYSYVEEIQNDGSKTLYHYTNISEAKDERFLLDFCDGKPSPFDKFSEHGYKRGKILSMTSFDRNGRKVKEKSYKYRDDNIERYNVLSSNFRLYVKDIMNDMDKLYYITGGVYKIFYPKYDVVSETEKTFCENGSVIYDSIHYYKSDISLSLSDYYPHQADVRVLDSVSHFRGNHSFGENYEYPFSKSLQNKDFCLAPIRTISKVDNKITQIQEKEFQNQLINGRDFEVPKYLLKKNSVSVDTLIDYISYTPKGAVARYKKRGEPVTSLLWGYNDSHVLGQIVNYQGDYIQIPYYFWNNPAKMLEYTQSLINKFPKAMITTYTYNPMCGMMSKTSPNGNTTYYEYNNPWDIRLTDIYDNQMKLTNHYEYNYQNK